MILGINVIQVCEDILESLAINYYVTCSPNLPRGFPGLTLWQQRWDTRSRSLTRCQGLNNHPFKGKIFDFLFFYFGGLICGLHNACASARRLRLAGGALPSRV